jgi:hypothetical protein
MGDTILNFSALQITQMESEMRLIHIKIAIHLLEVLLMLVWGPTGPSTITAPRKAADQIACRSGRIQCEHYFAPSSPVTVNLVDIPEWKVGIVFSERCLSDTFVPSSTNIEDTAFNRGNKNLLLGRKVKRVEPGHLFRKSVISAELCLSAHQNWMHLKISGRNLILLPHFKVQTKDIRNVAR